MMKPSKVFMCAKVTAAPCDISGSTIKKCAVCKHPIWVAPTTLKLVEKGDEFMCMGCVLKQDDLKPGTVTKEQVDEIKRNGILSDVTVKDINEVIEDFLKSGKGKKK